MAKNTQPIAKRCKALGISPAVMGYAKKNTTRNYIPYIRKIVGKEHYVDVKNVMIMGGGRTDRKSVV